jgi:hypothetical protein
LNAAHGTLPSEEGIDAHLVRPPANRASLRGSQQANERVGELIVAIHIAHDAARTITDDLG